MLVNKNSNTDNFQSCVSLIQADNERLHELSQVLETVFSSAAKERKQLEEAARRGEEKEEEGEGDDEREGDDSSVGRQKKASTSAFDDDDYGLQRAHKVDTSLLVYFFGKRGQDQLRFEDFHRFMDNLQTEVGMLVQYFSCYFYYVVRVAVGPPDGVPGVLQGCQDHHRDGLCPDLAPLHLLDE